MSVPQEQGARPTGVKGRHLDQARRWLPRLAAILAACALVLMGLRARLLAPLREAEDSWRDAGISWERQRDRFPARRANEAALRLEVAAGEAGLGLAPRYSGRPSHAGMTSAERAEFRAWWRELHGPEAEFPVAPELVRRRLTEHASEIDALAILLLDVGAPRWEYSREAPFLERPFPNLLGQLELHYLLLGRALLAAAAGDTAAAWRAIEASWIASTFLHERPELITQLIGIAVLRHQYATLRRAPRPDGRWPSRVALRDPRPGLIDAYVAEGWDVLELARGTADDFWGALSLVTPEGGIAKPSLVQRVIMPFMRRANARRAEELLVAIHAMQTELAAPCRPDALDDLVLPGPRNRFEEIVLLDRDYYAGPWCRATRLALSARLLAVARARDIGDAPRSDAPCSDTAVTEDPGEPGAPDRGVCLPADTRCPTMPVRHLPACWSDAGVLGAR